MTTATLPVPTTRPELVPAACRDLSIEVTGGLDGALRVAGLLRGRGYRVRRLTVDVGPATRLRCAVELTGAEADLLLARLHRLPAVLRAEPA